MSNAARKDRKRKGEKFEKAAKVPTYSVGLPRPKHSATPYQIAKAVDRALAAVRETKPVQDRLAEAAQFKGGDPEKLGKGDRVHAEVERAVTGERFDNAACPTCYAAPDEPCMTRAGKVASKPHAGR